MQHKARFRRTAIGVLILQMWFVWQALALDPQASSYLRSDFTVEEGLPDNEVNAITQTRNGFLWVGTDGGLARFDGEHFTQIRLRAGKSQRNSRKFFIDGGGRRTLGWHRFRACPHTRRSPGPLRSLAGDHVSPGRGPERPDRVPADPRRHSVGGNRPRALSV